ncbi:MAG: hypothetical protein ACI8W9_001027, partial [Psychromonas sp.]
MRLAEQIDFQNIVSGSLFYDTTNKIISFKW